MRLDPALLLPPARNAYRGPAIATWFLAAYTILATARSLVHVLAPDGGAGSVAGIDISVQGGANIVAIFGQWGLEQLLLALVAWVVLVRYREMVPLALLLAFLDLVGRFVVGQLKPLEIGSPPPGTIGTYVLLPLVLLFLAISIIRRDDA
jgi:hypothetical protein